MFRKIKNSLNNQNNNYINCITMEQNKDFKIGHINCEAYTSFTSIHIQCDKMTAIDLMKIITEAIQKLKEEHLKSETI